MYKINFHFVVYRYEAILAMIIFLLTGSFAMSSKDSQIAFPPVQRYPYSIAVTFDDGPHPEYTERILKILAEKHVPATFFVVGSQVFKHPGLARRISSCGHEIESHTMNHPNLKHLKQEQIKNELVMAQKIIRNVTGQESLYFRPPGGQFDKKVLSAASEMNLDMVLWTVFPKDHQEKNPEIIKKIVLEQSVDGGVIILHSGVDATIAALPEIIDELKNRGFRFLTVSQLKNESKKVQLAWLR